MHINLIDVIASAQRAFLYPIEPLYDSLHRSLKPDFQRALLRILRICDKDGDLILDDNDLVELQTSVFKKDLHKTHITALKQLVVNGDFDKAQSITGINFDAF